MFWRKRFDREEQRQQQQQQREKEAGCKGLFLCVCACKLVSNGLDSGVRKGNTNRKP